MSARSDHAPPHTWSEMPIAYSGDASALSYLAWQIRCATSVRPVPTSDSQSLECSLSGRLRFTAPDGRRGGLPEELAVKQSNESWVGHSDPERLCAALGACVFCVLDGT
jgi:hypothetical protein